MPQGFPAGSSVGKEFASNVGNLGLISGLGRSPGEGKGYPFQDSGLENSTDCTVHWGAKSRTQQSDFHFQAPATPLLGIDPEKTTIVKRTCTPTFIVALFTVARTWKQPRCPSTDEWIKKKRYNILIHLVYKHFNSVTSHKAKAPDSETAVRIKDHIVSKDQGTKPWYKLTDLHRSLLLLLP